MISLLLSGLLLMKPLDYGLVEEQGYITQTIYHTGFTSGDNRQVMVQYAYEKGGLEFVTMIECESGFNPKAKGDLGKSYGLCQMNSRWHKIPKEYYDNWEYQINYCYQKWKSGTKFYGPQRKINGQLCKDYVLNRFIIKGKN